MEEALLLARVDAGVLDEDETRAVAPAVDPMEDRPSYTDLPEARKAENRLIGIEVDERAEDHIATGQ